MDCWVQKGIIQIQSYYSMVASIDVRTPELLLQITSFNTFTNILESTKLN